MIPLIKVSYIYIKMTTKLKIYSQRMGSKMKSIALPLFLIFSIHLSISNAAVLDEVSALLSIKSSLIDPLNSLSNWRASNPHCQWTGIQCSKFKLVEKIDIAHSNISCHKTFATAFSNSIHHLTSLQALDISDNNFVGKFPSGIGMIPSLLALNASGNNFVGPLPHDISNVTSLEVLDFRGSYFTGEIPKSYKNLKRLKFLGLSGNELRGELPSELGQLEALEILIIGYNGFEGKIPKEFGNLSNLQYLDMAIGNLEGPIPPELGQLQLLTTVYLYKNNIEGEIPKEIGNISSLIYLDLSDNRISGKIPSELSNLSNLQLLNLMCNKLDGQIPVSIGLLKKLEVLELWNNSLTGPLPFSLGQNSSLQWLDVSSNLLTGVIPLGLCDGGNLIKLILFNNAFSGSIPNGLSSCLSLVRVRIQNNRLNGTIPIGFGKLPKLQRLEIASNELTGQIPDDISHSTSLSFIDLSNNHLQLSLPSTIFSIPTLQTLMISDNELTGEMPDQFQDSPNLSSIDLSNNHLSGTIPESISSCERLVSLILRGNQFSGEIPNEISMMSTLAILDLSSNQLTGLIPDNLGNSPALEMLNLSYNNLSGPVPENGMLKTINLKDLEGNQGLCGGPLPPCTLNSSLALRSKTKTLHAKHIIAAWLIGISSVLSVGILGLLLYRLYERWSNRFHEETGAWPWRLTAFQRINFTSTEILACIKESNIIGTGANGTVYKAVMPRHHVALAIKKLWRAEADSSSDIIGEVSLLGKLRHRNIVRMMGYMHNDIDAMIVYEYMPNGSLWDALHSNDLAARVLVDWVSRYNVAVGVAQGLAYLHHDCHPSIIHRDVKSNNILLDANLEVRIADFGLAKMMTRKNETVSMVAGSYGYIAPEYGYTLKVDQKSDIYSFGVVLMELLTGKRPIEEEFGECQDIVGWVRDKLRNGHGSEELLDKSIGGHCMSIREEMILVLRIAVLCTAQSPKDRPTMRDVLSMLGEAKPRRKSNSASNAVVDKDKPVFTPVTDSEFV